MLSVGLSGTARGNAFSSFLNLTVDGGSIRTNGAGGFTTQPGASTINLSNGADADFQFISNTFTLTMDGTSTLNFKGGGNPVNGGTIDMAPGAVVTFVDETVVDFTNEHTSKFFVNGSPAAIGTNLSVVSGSIVTAIPEPSSAILGIFGFLTLLRRKR